MEGLKDSEASSPRKEAMGRAWSRLRTPEGPVEQVGPTPTSTLLLASVLSGSLVYSRNQRIGGQYIQT